MAQNAGDILHDNPTGLKVFNKAQEIPQQVARRLCRRFALGSRFAVYPAPILAGAATDENHVVVVPLHAEMGEVAKFDALNVVVQKSHALVVRLVGFPAHRVVVNGGDDAHASLRGAERHSPAAAEEINRPQLRGEKPAALWHPPLTPCRHLVYYNGIMSKIVSNPPDPRAAIRVARNFGKYDLAAALADLIDNSIFAGATMVDISCRWRGGNPEIRIRDNGGGMRKGELQNAMRLACKNPDDFRDAGDLGRFGMGMKTASLSHARCLTVVTAKGGRRSAFRWDIDKMKDWNMEELDAGEILKASELGGKSGTEVIWNKIDRLPDKEDDYNRVVVEAADSLALIFHRYISPEKGEPLKVAINSILVDKIDPFCRNNPATQKIGNGERLKIGKESVRMTAYILPHFDKLGEDEYNRVGGEEGYLKNQGFYVYRNRRLIVHGTWFKLAKHGDMSRLARVMVDFPNALDSEWRINLDKTDIQLPAALRDRLRGLVDTIKKKSVRVYKNRGTAIKRGNAKPVWQRRATRERIRYEIDHSHPAVEQFLDSSGEKARRQMCDILNLVEGTLPVDIFHQDLTNQRDRVMQADTEPDELIATAINFARLYRKRHSAKALDDVLKSAEPFKANYKILAARLRKENLL